MKILFIILIVIALIIALVLIIALFVKKEIKIAREVIINKPKQQVFDYIKYLKNQDHFSKWAMMDPDMEKHYTGTDGTVGFISAWESRKSKNVGKGEQEIKKITNGERLDFEIRFVKPWESTAKSAMTTESISENQTKVRWSFESAMKYPMNIMRVFMNIDAMLGKDLEVGLKNLKAVLEKL